MADRPGTSGPHPERTRSTSGLAGGRKSTLAHHEPIGDDNQLIEEAVAAAAAADTAIVVVATTETVESEGDRCGTGT
ncbi:hypothetical protein C5746_43050 [Streptomyces atratus]|uniref:Uncharacterized protein n=1 Tax=Streptomyces atratus TaxID=1893 RepID=A0A2Z5J5V0_STRAR|nr:hypothetical protein C5746_00185 [Streptomyces atratus]AXE82487.1 hypothetical protein C5746_43050 [Streptomyces atratus]